jgi:hypothetical protein
MAERSASYAGEGKSSPEATPVLVAVMNNHRDFEIAQQQHWYRIPLSHTPRRLGAEYLAFYQTQAFGQERWAIHYYAPIRRVHLAQRRDLLPEESEHPRADDWYYRIEIGPLECLPSPIPSRRLRRIAFIPTTLARLLSAREINDLWLGTEEEERLWEAFKQNEIAVERRVRLREGDEDFSLDFAAPCCLGNLAILCNREGPLAEGSALREQPAPEYELASAGWWLLRFSPQQIEDSLEACLALVGQTIAELGGLEEEFSSHLEMDGGPSSTKG